MASRQFRGQRSSKHSEHDDRFDTRTAKNSERSSRRFDNFEKNRDLSSKYDEESTNVRRTSSFADKPSYKGRQYHSRNDNELRENIENKIKFQESFGIERRPSKRFELENTKKVNDDFENSGRRSTNNETSKTGEIKDLRQLLQSKRRQSHDDKAENDKKPSISERLGSKIKEEDADDKHQPRTDRNSSRFSENSARLVNRFLDVSRKPSKVEEKSSKLQQSDKKPSSVDEKLAKNDEVTSEPPQRIRKPVRIRNPASRLADLVRNQVVDAVKKNEKKKSSTNSTSSKSTSHESLIEISSSSDDVKIVEVSKPIEKELDTAMDRLKTDFDEISNSGSENWADIVEEEEIAEKIEIPKKHEKVDLHTTIMAALKRNRECIQDPLIQVDKNTEKHVEFKEPIKPESSTLQRSSSMSSLAEIKPQIQKNQPRVEHQKNQQPEPRQPNRFQRNQSNQLHRTHSQHYNGSQPRRMQRTNAGHFEAPPAIRPDVANSIEFQKFRFGSTYEYNPLTKQYMHQGPSPFHHQVPMPQNQPQRYNSINWNEYPQRDAQIRDFEANYEPQQILNYPQEETRNSNYQEIPNLTSNYQEIPHLTSNYQEVQNLTSNNQIIPAIPNIYNFPPPKLDSIQFQPQNIQNFIDFQDSAKFKERTPSPAPSTSSSSSSSSATDLFGAPSKLSARLSMIRENKTKFSDGNKSSSLESLKSNGFNANAKVFYPKQSDTSIVPYQQQVESTEPLFYDSHHSFELSAYVDESLDEIEEPCDKLTHDQLVNLMYVTKTSKKYINEALSYFVEYYDELGCKLSKNAVDEVLMEKGIESKISDFGQML